MNFSTNQVMQFYVADTAASIEDAKSVIPSGFTLKIGDNKTDIIDNVMWGKYVVADAMAIPFTVAEVVLDASVNGGLPIAGEDYVVRVSYPEVAGLGIEGWTTKTAVVHASSKVATAKGLYEELAKALTKAFEADGVLTAKADESGVSIEPADPTKNFEAGRFPVVMPQFKVTTSLVTLDGEEVMPFVEASLASKESDSDPIVNGYKVAEMEYFALGERGDQYRKIGWPDYISTDYKVKPTEKYNMLIVHYTYKGANDTSYNSEKDLIIVSTEDLSTKAKAIATKAGVTFTQVDATGKETVLA